MSVVFLAIQGSAPPVPQIAEDVMPKTDSFADGLWYLIRQGIGLLAPSIREGAGICLCLIALALLCSLLSAIGSGKAAELACAVTMGTLLLSRSHSMIALGVETVQTLTDYAKLLLPVMTGILAGQGGLGSSAALYTLTMAGNAILSTFLTKIGVPLLYGCFALMVASCAGDENRLGKLTDFGFFLITWVLKTVIFLFTGCMGITNVITGGADAAAIKATKLTISGVVPVVGGMLSDASEAVLTGAALMKRAAGLYGMFAILAICLSPFLRIGCQYLLLKATAALCALFGKSRIHDLIGTLSKIMGVLLGMIGAVCLMLLVSLVCFMKGMEG